MSRGRGRGGEQINRSRRYTQPALQTGEVEREEEEEVEDDDDERAIHSRSLLVRSLEEGCAYLLKSREGRGRKRGGFVWQKRGKAE